MRTRALLVAMGVVSVGALAVVIAAPVVGQGSLQRGPWVPSFTIVYGGYRQVEDMSAVRQGEAWGVDYTFVTGPSGIREQTAFVHAENGAWRVAQVVDGAGLRAVDIANSEIGFAVGGRGSVYRYDGRWWRQSLSPTPQDLTDVALVSRDEGWAVGERATILRWDGLDWAAVPSPIGGSRLTGVAAPGPEQAWAVSLGGQILRLLDGEWVVDTAPSLARATGIAFAGPRGDGMAIGLNVLLYDRQTDAWSELEGPAEVYASVAWGGGSSGDYAYLVGDDSLWAYTPEGEFEPVTFDARASVVSDRPYVGVASAPDGAWGLAADGSTVLIDGTVATYVRPAADEMLSLDMVTTEFGWAGGRSVVAPFVGSRDGQWSLTEPGDTGVTVRALDLLTETDGWAVGEDAGALRDAAMWRWDGEHWSPWPIDKTWVVGDIEMLAPDDGWVSKGNLIGRWDGERWRQLVGTPYGASLGGLGMLRGGDDPDGWFGGQGRLFHLRGDTWEAVTLTQEALVVDIEMADELEGWAITDQTLYRYDGEQWLEEELPLGEASVLYDVDAPARGNAWILADPEGLYHWDGSNWERHDLSPFGDAFEPIRLRALRPDEESLATDVWLVGRRPSIGRYRVVAPVGTLYMPAVCASCGR